MHFIAIGIAIALILTGYVLFFKSLHEDFNLQHEINSKLPVDQQFEPTMWGFGTRLRFLRLKKEYQAKHQHSWLHRQLGLIGMVCVLAGLGLLLFEFGFWH